MTSTPGAAVRRDDHRPHPAFVGSLPVDGERSAEQGRRVVTYQGPVICQFSILALALRCR